MNSIIASNLKKMRKHFGWSQDRAAELIGIKRSRLASYEEGRAVPGLELFPKLITVYRIIDWHGFLTNTAFEPITQSAPPIPPTLIEQRYSELSPKDKRLADSLLNLD